MDYTPNYHLPQWEKNDRVLMEDFNQMYTNIEKGIDSPKNECKAGENQTIVLGFRPCFVIISGADKTQDYNDPTACTNLIGMTAGNKLPLRIRIEENGFTVLTYHFLRYSTFTDKDRVYDYIAFR